jgi:hypothetical protein
MGEDEEATLSSTEVAAILKKHPTTVWRIPFDELPYEVETRAAISETGRDRQGRRRYRRAAVEAYQQGVRSQAPTELEARVRQLEERQAQVESDVTSIRAWLQARDRQEPNRDHPDHTT